MNQRVSWLHYFHAPLVKEKTESYLMLESIRNKVWNPVFTTGTITFFLSMTLRGFFDQAYAVIPLAISTLLLLSGVWILSATAQVVFDKDESRIYFIYKHLGYLQKIYVYPLTSIEQVMLEKTEGRKLRLQLLKDDGLKIKVAAGKHAELLNQTAHAISGFLNIPVKSN